MTTDVIVVGDGPAGTALATALHRAGVDVLLLGDGATWPNTYGVWVDEVASAELLQGGAGPERFLSMISDDVVAWTRRRQPLGRRYGFVDNDRLQRHLRADVPHRVGRVASSSSGGEGVVLVDGAQCPARLVVDATGWPPALATKMDAGGSAPAWQTAFGVVLPSAPRGDLGEPTIMDFRPVDDDPVVTFAYSLPVERGWLVEETVLAGRPAVDPGRLSDRLANRLGMQVDELMAVAVETERVRIPMGGPTPARDQSVAAFGAAAGGIHPISGYSIGSSLRRAPVIASAIASSLASRGGSTLGLAAAVWDATWPLERRRSRVLHDYGLEMLLRLDQRDAQEFFETFFDLPSAQWSAFMRSDTSPGALASTMATIFRRSSWRLRRRLAGGNLLTFRRLLQRR